MLPILQVSCSGMSNSATLCSCLPPSRVPNRGTAWFWLTGTLLCVSIGGRGLFLVLQQAVCQLTQQELLQRRRRKTLPFSKRRDVIRRGSPLHLSLLLVAEPASWDSFVARGLSKLNDWLLCSEKSCNLGSSPPMVIIIT